MRRTTEDSGRAIGRLTSEVGRSALPWIVARAPLDQSRELHQKCASLVNGRNSGCEG